MNKTELKNWREQIKISLSKRTKEEMKKFTQGVLCLECGKIFVEDSCPACCKRERNKLVKTFDTMIIK